MNSPETTPLSALLDDVRFVETTLIRSSQPESNEARYAESMQAMSRISTHLIHEVAAARATVPAADEDRVDVRRRFQRAFPAGISVGEDLLMTPERIRSLNDIEDLLAGVSPSTGDDRLREALVHLATRNHEFSEGCTRCLESAHRSPCCPIAGETTVNSKRFTPSSFGTMIPDPYGAWVRYEDTITVRNEDLSLSDIIKPEGSVISCGRCDSPLDENSYCIECRATTVVFRKVS